MVRVVWPLMVVMGLLAPVTVHSQSLLGSRASVDLMYDEAEGNGLYFYQTANGVRRAADNGTLVRLGGNGDYQLSDVSYPYVLPAARTFVERLASQYRNACGERLVVTSAIRPKSFQLINSNDRSVHPTGMAIDLRRPASSRCLTWLRTTLASLEKRGVIEATEEKRPPHFHVAVFPRQYQQYVRGGAAASGTRLASAAAEQSEERYTVRRGDSIWAISRRTQVSVEEIKLANNLTSSRILAGQVIVIPR